MREALKHDRARVQIGRISRFGLLEMSRQRLRPSLGESSLRTCPTCIGRGHVRGPESLALSILRIVEEEAMKDSTDRVVARLPIEVATFLLNEKREGVFDIEQRTGVRIVLVPDPSVTLPNYEVKRLREDDQRNETTLEASYQMTAEVDATSSFTTEPSTRADEPAVKIVPPPAPSSPLTPGSRKTGLFSSLWSKLFGKREHPTRTSSAGSSQSRGVRHGARRDTSGLERSESRRRGTGSRRGTHRAGHGEGRRRRDERREPAAGESAAAEPEVPATENAAAPGGESRSRTGRRSSRRGRRGGSRNRNRDSARPGASNAGGVDAVSTETSAATTTDATNANADSGASAGSTHLREPNGTGSPPDDNGGRVETTGDNADSIGPDAPVDADRDSACPPATAHVASRNAGSRDADGTRPPPRAATAQDARPAEKIEA